MILNYLGGFLDAGIFKNIIRTSTFRQSLITFSGTFINGILGAVFYILTARFLGPSSFGLMTVAITILTLVADISDLGTDTGIVNFVPKYLKEDPEKVKKFLKLGLSVKLIISTVVLILGLVFAKSVASVIFAKPELSDPIKIAFIGVGSLLLFSFLTHTLQAYQKFWAWSGIQVATNTARVVLIYFFLLVGIITLNNVLILYISIPFLGFIIGFLLLDRKVLFVKNVWSVSKEFFKYNKWVASFTLLAAFSSRLDTFLSARLLSNNELGIYSAATNMVKIVPQLVVAIGTVIGPKMASIGNVDELKIYLKKTQVYVLSICILGIVSIPVVLYLIPILFGVEYLSSGPIFVILLIAMLTFLFSVPIHMSIFYYFSYPKLFFWLSLFHLIIILSFGWFLISTYGVLGAALTVLVGQVFNFVIPLIWVIRKMRS